MLTWRKIAGLALPLVMACTGSSQPSVDEDAKDDDDTESSADDDDDASTSSQTSTSDESESSATADSESSDLASDTSAQSSETSDEDAETDSSTQSSGTATETGTSDESLDCQHLKEAGKDGSPGTVIPDFHYDDGGGEPFKLHSACNDVVVVVGGAMWCPVCQAHAKTLSAWQSQFADQGFQGVYVVWNNADSEVPTPADLEEWKVRYDLKGPVVLAPDRAWIDAIFGGAEVSGGMVLLDRAMVVAKKNTVHGSSEDIVTADIEALLEP